MRSVYDVVEGTTGDAYRSLVRAVGTISRWFGLVQMSTHAVYIPPVRQVMNDLVPFLADIEQVREWPRTRVVGERTETRLLFDVTPESVDLILGVSSSFWDWANTDYPDDLHFLRSDRSVVLGSTWCTRVAWLELDASEFQVVSRQLSSEVRLKELPEELGWG